MSNEYKKSLDKICKRIFCGGECSICEGVCELLEPIQDLVDKATPLTVNYISYGDADGYPVYDTIQCPTCTETFEIEEVDIKQYKYCPYCGQHWDNIKLDYMEED